MEYEQYTLEELQKLFEKEQNLEELDKTMGTLINKMYYLTIMKKQIMSS